MFFKVNTFFIIISIFFSKSKKYFLWALFFMPIFSFSQVKQDRDSGDVFYGKASYYDEYFNGRKTANGEIFSHKLLTAAHPTWPFNTKVKITNLANKNSVTVRINDRGPFIKGRHIDVSKQVAVVLGFINAGVVDVKMEVLKWGTAADKPILASAKTNKTAKTNPKAVKIKTESKVVTENQKVEIAKNAQPDSTTLAENIPVTKIQNKPPIKEKVKEKKVEKVIIKETTILCADSDSLSGWCVQVGSYGSRANANKAVKTVTEITKEWVCIQEIQRNEVTLYRVVCGKEIENKRAFEIKELLSKKYPDAFTTNYSTLKNNNKVK